uniref:Aminopeptidase N-like N-terminal domain-containing protein n=1 Tax=Acrobeloides nanus TaxID=290746 RepID=A0A914D8W2_9BILA
MLQYAVRLNIGDARQVALQFWNNGNVSTLNPDLRRAVYCGAILNDDGTNFNVLLAMFLQIELTGYYTSRELNSIAQGLACAQNPQVITKVLDLFADRSSSGYRYNIHPAFSNFYHNPVASDVMADYLKNSSANNSTYYLFLDGFLSNRRGAYTYSDMTRWMYDEYVPLGQIPWLKQLDETIVPDQYVVSVQPYFPGSYNYSIGKNFTYDGEVSIFARKVGPIQTVIMLNSHRQIIHHIRVFNQPPTGNLTELNYTSIVRDYDNATLTIHLGQPIPVNGNIQISIKYSGFIDKGPAEGTYVNWDYLEYNKQKSWIFATDFEGGPSTRSLVPCYDEPSKKAIWYVTVIYPTDMVAISNTLEESVINLGNGLSKTTFKPTEKMSSYLLAISVGDFAALRGLTKDGKLVRVWTWTGMQNNGELSLRVCLG